MPWYDSEFRNRTLVGTTVTMIWTSPMVVVGFSMPVDTTITQHAVRFVNEIPGAFSYVIHRDDEPKTMYVSQGRTDYSQVAPRTNLTLNLSENLCNETTCASKVDLKLARIYVMDERAGCKEPDTPSFANYKLATLNGTIQEATFTCDDNYQSRYKLNPIFCPKLGDWSQALDGDTCLPLTCPRLQIGGVIYTVELENQRANLGTKAHLSCNNYGTELKPGSNYIECINGDWQGELRCVNQFNYTLLIVAIIGSLMLVAFLVIIYTLYQHKKSIDRSALNRQHLDIDGNILTCQNGDYEDIDYHKHNYYITPNNVHEADQYDDTRQADYVTVVAN